jgi:glutathione peroxidase-family protein
LLPGRNALRNFEVFQSANARSDVAPARFADHWLTEKSKNGVSDSEVSWNFQKYMIDEKGHLVDYVSPKTQPDDAKILNWIKGDS